MLSLRVYLSLVVMVLVVLFGGCYGSGIGGNPNLVPLP